MKQGGSRWISPPLSFTRSSLARAEITVGELIDAHVRHAHTYYVDDAGKPTTEVANYETATTPLREMFGPIPADEFTPSKLKAVRSRMIGKGWARTNIYKHTSRVRSIFNWGVEEELVPAAIYQALRSVKGLKKGRSAAKESAPVKAVPDAWVNAIEKHVAPQVWALAQLQRLTGARGGELFKLRSIDLDTSGPVWTHTPKKHKTEHFGHKRIIYFGPKAIEVLRPFIAGRATDAYLFSPREGNAARQASGATKGQPRRPNQKPNSAKTARRVHEHYNRESYRRAIARGCKLAEAPHWHPHQLRHNAATLWRKTYGPDVALTLLGDKTTRMVDVYAEKDHEAAMRVVAQIG